MPDYWVYENLVRRQSRMHLAECRFCRNGRGIHQKIISEINGHWLGPFHDRSAALKALNGTGQPDRRPCETCSRTASG